MFEAGFQTPGLLILDRDDQHNYQGVSLPEGWEIIVRPRMYLSEKINVGVAYKPQEPWYGVLNDDHLPQTPDWDRRLVEAVKNQKIVWPKDNYADRISTPVMDGDLVRSLGWVACPDLKHFYIDDVHELLAEVFGCLRLEEVTVSHEHVNKGRMKPDQTYLDRPNSQADRIAYMRWCKEKWPALREKLGC